MVPVDIVETVPVHPGNAVLVGMGVHLGKRGLVGTAVLDGPHEIVLVETVVLVLGTERLLGIVLVCPLGGREALVGKVAVLLEIVVWFGSFLVDMAAFVGFETAVVVFGAVDVAVVAILPLSIVRALALQPHLTRKLNRFHPCNSSQCKCCRTRQSDTQPKVNEL